MRTDEIRTGFANNRAVYYYGGGNTGTLESTTIDDDERRVGTERVRERDVESLHMNQIVSHRSLTAQ